MRLHYVLRKHVSHVELRKERKSSVGIVPKGVTKRGKPTVKSIVFNSIAHKSQCVGVGDVILSVCGRDSSGMGKRDFKRLSTSTEVVQLELEYEIREPRLNTSGIYQLKRESVHIKKMSCSFGFVLRKVGKKYSVASEYPILSTIAQHEAFSKDFSLRSGDRLIQIDDQDLSWLSLEQISDILAQKEEATFLIEYSVGIIEPCTRPGRRTELEMECLDSDIGIVLASSKSTSNLHIKEIQKGSLAERCGVFQVGDTVLYINDISTSHLSISDANALLKSFRKVPGRLTSVHSTQEETSKDVNTHILDSSTFVKKDLHPVLSAVPSERLHLIPPQNSPESLYNCHFKRTHSKLPKTDRKSFDFQLKTISMLNDIVQKVTALQELINFHKHRPNLKEDRRNCTQQFGNFFHECQTSQKVQYHNNQEDYTFGNFKRNQLSDWESKDFVKIDASTLSQLEALCTETNFSVRTIAMHFVKNTISVSLVNDSIVDTLSGDISYFTREKIIHELTENLAKIHTKKLMPKQSLDMFLQNVSAVDFDCCDCYQLCLSAALTVQKVMLLLTLNDPDLDAMFVINALLLNTVNVDVPCVDCSTPWCSVSEVGKESSQVKEEDKHSCDLLCHSKTIEVDPLILGSSYKTDSLGSQDSRKLLLRTDSTSSQDFPKRLGVCSQDFKKLGKRPEVNLNIEDRSAYYSLAQVESGQSYTASESDTVSSLQPKKMVINTRNIRRGTNSLTTSQRSHAFTEVPSNSPNGFKVTKKEQVTPRRTMVEGNYSQNCKEKTHVGKHLPTIPKQLWKSAEAITKNSGSGLFRKLKSVITRHASDPTGFSKTPVDLFQNDNTSCRPTSPALGGNDCEPSQITSSNITDSNPLTDTTLGRIKTCSSSMEVNLKNEGKEFGLEIEYLSYPRDGVTLTIISDVEPDTAAANSGILLKGDRIVKINGQATTGLTLEEFSNLTKEAFSGDEVTLSVNFDVALPEVRFGTFDIHFDKILKPGLEFKDFSKGGPLVVRGVAKGSAAHRSGQLFAGDEILFTNCIRQEAFDSCRCAYTRTDMVIMTVSRERTEPESFPESEENMAPPHSPSNSTTDASTVHRTSLHTVSGSGALVVEQALTLCRDPGLGDFGFLVGKNLGTGGMYVTGIRPGGPADKSGVVKKNDRIVKIDGTLVGNESSSLSLLLQAGETLELTTCRMLPRQIN